MAASTKLEDPDYSSPRSSRSSPATSGKPVLSADSITKSSPKTKHARSNQTVNGDRPSSPFAANGSSVSAKRRCVSTACIACRKRKSKCDGNTPSCAACSSVYGTECIYDPNSDHRRKGVYKKDIDNLKTRNSTLQTLIQAILNFPENEIADLVKQIRTCESLDDVAESIIARENAVATDEEELNGASSDSNMLASVPKFEKELSGKMGKLRLENGSVSIIGGTSNLIYIENNNTDDDDAVSSMDDEPSMLQHDPVISWTEVTKDARLIMHLMNMYFTWHYTYFTTLSKSLFWHDFKQGKQSRDTKRKTEYCTPLLVNAMLALGCHFTSWPDARADREDSATAGDHFFREAKRLILENDEHEKPRLATVQALALMSVREAGCGREARGWIYSGMSFRMAYDLGLNIDSGGKDMDESEVDARRVTIWGCFLFDKCWSNYLGRQPQLPLSSIAAPKFDVFPDEDAETWRPFHDTGSGQSHSQPARTRAVALQTSQLCEISGDLLLYFYHPTQLEKPMGKQAELKKLSELHTRLEAWRKSLPKEMEPREGQLPNVLVMHMFFQLLFIHLFRPFLKYKQSASPLPSHVSPRKFLLHSAATISKLLRLYRRTYGLRQICNIVVYIAHTACTVHLLNLPDKIAQRDITHGLAHLEEIAEGWLCARRALGILHLVARRWKVELPETAAKTFQRTDAKFGPIHRLLDQNSHADHDQNDGTTSTHEDNNSTSAFPSTAPSTAWQSPIPLHEQGQMPAPFLPDAYPATTKLSRTAPPPQPSPSPQPSILQGTPNITRPPAPPSQMSRQSRQKYHAVPPASATTWNNQQQQQQQPVNGNGSSMNGNGSGRVVAGLQSPTMLFGGVQGLIQDQDWWLRDSNHFFANWNIEAGGGGGGGGVNGNGNGNPGSAAEMNGNGGGNGGGGGAGYNASNGGEMYGAY